MKIALAQINPHIGNFEENKRQILSHIDRAQREGAHLVVFPELSVCGYPPQDFLEHSDFIRKVQESIEEIASHCQGIAAIVGGPSPNPSPRGKRLFNSAFFLCDGLIHSVRHKTLLPDYDVFDEYRYFEQNREFECIEYLGERFALTICEDLWDELPGSAMSLYQVVPMEEYASLSPDFVINISASPFSYNQQASRLDVLKSNARRFHVPVLYINQVGANTELIFDGGSMVVNASGQVVEQLALFENDFRLIDSLTIQSKVPVGPTDFDRVGRIHDALVLGIRDYFEKMGFRDATLGLSGGVDSALTLVLAARALGPDHVHVLLLPSKYSSDHSVSDSIKLAENLGVSYHIVSIQAVVDETLHALAPVLGLPPYGITEENIQARTRGVFLMALSNRFGNILLNTSNKSEAAVGYGTLYGDMNGGLSVLGDVYKTDVYRLGDYINRQGEVIPLQILTKPPSAELRPDQKDSDSLPDYPILDGILFAYIEEKKTADQIIAQGFEAGLVHRVIRLVNSNEYKRFQAPPILRVSSKAFGVGRRMPIVGAY